MDVPDTKNYQTYIWGTAPTPLNLGLVLKQFQEASPKIAKFDR